MYIGFTIYNSTASVHSSIYVWKWPTDMFLNKIIDIFYSMCGQMGWNGVFFGLKRPFSFKILILMTLELYDKELKKSLISRVIM